MKRYLLLLFSIFCGLLIHAQCLTNSLIINTGYNPISGTALTGGANGATAVPDPHWIVTAESPSIPAAMTASGIPGLVEAALGASADVIETEGSWASAPSPASWISCLNSNTYYTDGTGATGTTYSMTLTRPFRMCSADSVTVDIEISDDNWISSIDVDGTVLPFSESGTPSAPHYTSFTHLVKTLYLPAGTHDINVVVNNYNDPGGVEDNPTGLIIYGTVASADMTNSIVAENFASCASYTCSFTCNTLTLPDTMRQCAGDVIVLPATLSGTDSVLDITWSPITGLASSTVLDPSLTVGVASAYYYITVRSLIPFNLVSNGNFSEGNIGFTSSYTYAPPPSTTLLEGNYSVYTNPFGVHTGFTSMGDHTTGTGNMMILNGGPTPTDVWCETIPVTPNTDYDFSTWVANCSSVTVGVDVPIIQFKINGVLIGTPTSITSAPGAWTNFFSIWNSGVNTTATICIYDLNTTPAGNDFALDDISFNQVCVAQDSVYIAIRVPDTTVGTTTDTAICITSAPITLTAPGGFASYLWNTGSAATSILATTAGNYWVYNNSYCATLIDTTKVIYFPLPTVSLGNDTAFCIGNTLVLSSVQPAGTSYLWSTGATGSSITVSTSGTYWLQVYNGCTVADSIHITVSPFPIVNLGPDTGNCHGTAIVLSSSGSYTAPAYLWSNGATTATDTVVTTATYWLMVTVAGCPAADTINVTIIYDTFTLANTDTAICRGASVQAILTANPAATFQWLPTAGIPVSNVSSPKITPDTSAMYKVHIDIAGCPEIVDSFYIDVQPYPIVYLGTNRQVCAYDTLHLVPIVSPRWYGHYAYAWSPGAYLDDSSAGAVVFRPGDNTKMILTVSTPAGCTGSDSVQLTVNPGNFATLDTVFALCPGDSVQFVPSGGVSYTWHPGVYLNDSTSATPWVHPITSQHYVAVAVSQFGCLDTVNASVVVRPAAVINLPDSVTIAPGDAYQANPQNNCSTFEWFPPAGLDYDNVANPVMTPQGSTKYVVHGTTVSGCKTADSIYIIVDISTSIALPNAFTPGGTVNNKFYILKFGGLVLNYFRIFNRWGNKVYESTNINEGWDGNFNGKPQPYDVYVYELEAVGSDGKVFHKHGNLTLIR